MPISETLMKKTLINILLISAVVAVLAGSVSAWDDTGHKLTAYIAWQQMSPEVREKVFDLILKAPEDSDLSVWYSTNDSRSVGAKQLEIFMISASWADIVRNREFKVRFEKYNHSNWHYADVFWKQDRARAEVLKDFTEESGKAVTKLYEFRKILEDSSSADADKAIALAWLMHVGGDIHNPLHNASRVTEPEPKGDLGGNLFLLSPENAAPADRMNLHYFWDSVITRNMPRKDNVCDSDYIGAAAEKIMRRFPISTLTDRIKPGDFMAWHDEGLRLLPTVVYSPNLKRNEMPPRKYQRTSFELGQELIAIAGYRLGATLNQIFTGSPERKTSAIR